LTTRIAAWVTTVGFVLSLAPRTAASAERPLSLEEAIAYALQKNESIFIERESVSAAKAGVSGSKGAYDPMLEVGGEWRRDVVPSNSPFSGAPPGEDAPTVESAEADVSISQYLPSGGTVSLRASGSRVTTDGTFYLLSPAYSTQVGVELRQPLLRNLRTDAARVTIRVANAEQERALAAFRQQITETIAAVERAYWALIAARRDVEVRAESVRLAEEQLSETQIRIQSGAAPEDEIAQPRAELERRRGEQLAAQEAASRAENALKILILSDVDAELWTDQFAPAEEAEVTPETVDVAAAMERALRSRPELAVAAAVVQRRAAETAFARDGVWPSLDAVVSYDRYGLAGTKNPAAAAVPGLPDSTAGGAIGDLGDSFSRLGDGDFYAARAGVVLGLPIRNRTARGAAAAAHSAERQAEADLARLRKTIRVEVLDAIAALQTAAQRIEAARSGREQAEVQLAAERDRYGAGLSINFLVLTRQNDLSLARLTEISALTDYRTARTELARATGSLLELRRIDVDKLTP
jgi:outer membrane protein TolC